MKRFLLLLAFGGFLNSLSAQQSTAAIEAKTNESDSPKKVELPEAKYSPSGVAAKILVTDFGIKGDNGKQLTNGIELAYLHEINKLLTVALPVKLGMRNQLEDLSKRQTFIDVDVVGQFGFPILKDKLRPYALVGVGTHIEPNNGVGFKVPYGAGIRYRITEAASVTAQYEIVKSFSKGVDNKQFGIGLIFNFGKAKFDPKYWDSDYDGVADKDDLCPDIVGLKEYKGCLDSDGDGIHDGADPCPNHHGSRKDGGCPDSDDDGIGDPNDQCPDTPGVAEYNGCPIPDADKDGFPDAKDECPEIAGTLNGCPDTDADGIADAKDECPKQAGPKATNGCPDRDNDLVADYKDNCPLMPGKFNGCPDRDGDGVDDASDKCPNIAGLAAHDGCPEIMKQERQLFEFAVRALRFDNGSLNLEKDAYPHLTGLADVLKQYPSYHLKITGHADFEEVVPNREAFSLERAKACANYIYSLGIDENRIILDGVGAGQPIVRKGDASERAVNRRVEFDLYDSNDK